MDSDSLKQFCSPFKNKRRFYTPAEIREHCTAGDAWVSLFDRVYNISSWVESRRGHSNIEAHLELAGTDVSYLFHGSTGELRVSQWDEAPAPHLEVSLQAGILPLAARLSHPDPWWQHPEFIIGSKTKKVRPIRIYNTLAKTEDKLEVPEEESIAEIQVRYGAVNSHAQSYTWKFKGKVVEMTKTLQENGVPDDSGTYAALEVPQEKQYVPVLHLYFNDDLTIQ